MVGIVNLLLLVEFPSEKGITIDENSNILELNNSEKPVIEVSQPMKSISFWGALMIPGVLLFSLSFFFIKFSMYGFYYWLPSYLQECLNYSKDASANIFSLFGVGSIFGNLLMGLSTDLLPLRSPVFMLGIFLSTLSVFALTIWGNE